MKIDLLLTIILVICHVVQMINVPYTITTYERYIPKFFSDSKSKWFLLNKYLFYIEWKQKFISNEAQQYCKNDGMQDAIHGNESQALSELLSNNYGTEASCWLAEYTFPENGSSNACYALNSKGISSEDCNSRKCVICKQEISGGSLQYKNGSHFELNIDETNQFCNPESNKYDKLLQYCLIKSIAHQTN